MQLEAALRIRKEAGVDPDLNLEIRDEFSGPGQLSLNKKEFLSYEELGAFLLQNLQSITGGSGYSFYPPVKGTMVSAIFMDYFGDYQPKVLRFLRRISGLKVEVPGSTGYMSISLTNRFILRFSDMAQGFAIASSAFADLMGLKVNSIPISIKGKTLRVLFSRSLKGPLFFDGTRASYEANGWMISFGELILPISSCHDLFGVECGGTIKFDEALELARTKGSLDPYFSFPRSVLKLRLVDDETIEGNDRSVRALIESAVPFEIRNKEIRLTDKNDERTKALVSILRGELGGIPFSEPYRGRIKIMIRLDRELKELNRYDGALPARSRSMRLRLRYCASCGRITPFRLCERCGAKTREVFYCRRCNIYVQEKVCPKCGSITQEAFSDSHEFAESLSLVSERLGYRAQRELSLPESVKGEPELPDKAILRNRLSVLTSRLGFVVFPIKLHADNIPSDEILLPSKLESSIRDVVGFVNEELTSVYRVHEIPELGDSVVLFNKPMNAAVELRIKGFKSGSEALVNPSVIEFANAGSLDNQAYIALSEDFALNCIPSSDKSMVIYRKLRSGYLAAENIEQNRTPIYQQPVPEIIRGIIRFISRIYPDELNGRDAAEVVRKLEALFVRQRFVCQKCGLRLSLPTISMKCPRCGSNLAPLFSSSDLNSILLELNNVVQSFEGTNYRELIELYINNIRNMFRTSSQMSLGEFW